MKNPKIKIAVFTTSRAEFGILYPLIKQISVEEDIEFILFVGGAHLAEEYGKTINEIKDLGITITDTFDYLLNGDDSFSISKSFGIASYELARIFEKYEFDFVCVLGDRFELLSIIGNAILFRKPIIHISGGERTEGAIDEQIRHMISKAAHLHFVSCEEYAENLQKMGEPARRIFNTGALNVDNMVRLGGISKEELFEELNLDIQKPTAVMTYHPVTLEYSISPNQQVRNVFEALEPFNLQLVVTAPNIEVDRNQIISIINDNMKKNRDLHYFESLGFKQYHSLIPNCEFVIGNSSSGIVEAPYFKIPTVNIGDRQNGRIRHESVIDTGYSVKDIQTGIRRALSSDFRKRLNNMPFKFGDGHAAERIVDIIKGIKIDQDFMRKRLEFFGYQDE